jgi:hypothetical protein
MTAPQGRPNSVATKVKKQILVLIALLPGYATLGVRSLVLLISLRFLDGIVMGGENTSNNTLALWAAASLGTARHRADRIDSVDHRMTGLPSIAIIPL